MKPRELTIRGLILGALITTVFTAANVYLGLKVGLTTSASIPILGALVLGPLISLASHKWTGLLLWWKPFNPEDVAKLKDMIADGTLRPAIDRQFALDDLLQDPGDLALRELESRRVLECAGRGLEAGNQPCPG